MVTEIKANEIAAWTQWCRLCGKDDPQGNINVFFKDEQMTANLTLSASIGKYFYINITENDELPKMLCKECLSLVTSLDNFFERIDKVQAMFSALYCTNPAVDINFYDVRLKYGLEDNNRDHILNPLMEILADESKISSLVISEKIENTAHQIKTEAIWIDDYKDNELNGYGSNKEEDINKNRDCLGEGELSAKMNYSRANDNIGTKDDSELSSGLNNEPPKRRLRYSEKWAGGYHVDQDQDDAIADENSNVNNVQKNSFAEPKFTCTDCGRKFRRINQYDQHMKRMHKTRLDNPLLSSAHKKRSDYQSKAYLKYPTTNHRIRRKNNQNESVENSNEADAVWTRGPKSTVCPLCGKNFTTTTIMQTHMNNIHLGEKNFICEKCGVPIKSMGALNEHMLTHTEERPFKCEVCNKGFKNKMQLKYHLEIHDAHKHICPKCGLQLNSSKTLNRHLLVHSDQKKYKCDYCGRQFKQGKTLKNHLIIHTGLKPYSCNFCDKTFSFGSSCRAHKKRVHPQELAALEASGKLQKSTTNIPSLELLKAVTKAAVDANL